MTINCLMFQRTVPTYSPFVKPLYDSYKIKSDFCEIKACNSSKVGLFLSKIYLINFYFKGKQKLVLITHNIQTDTYTLSERAGNFP